MTSLAVGYGRVSTPSGESGGNSEEFQRSAIDAFCKREGFTLELWRFDDGVTGVSHMTEREKAIEVTRTAISLKCPIVVYRFDRAFRSIEDFAVTVRKLKERGVKMVSATEGSDIWEPGGYLTASILVAVAEHEWAGSNQRKADSLAARKEAGHQIAGEPRYGIKFVDKGRRRKNGSVRWDEEPEPVEQLMIRRILGMHDNGLSLMEIAGKLNDDRVPTRRGGPWSKATVRKIVVDGRKRLVKWKVEAGGGVVVTGDPE